MLSGKKTLPWGFLEWFAVAQVMLPGLLYLPGTQWLRVPIRMAPFLLSLYGFTFLRGKSGRIPQHPSVTWLVWAMLYLVLMIAHPTTNSLLAGTAQVMLYFCVMAPIFWAPRIVESPKQISRLLKILLFTNGINAIMGVLQIYDPDTWMPKELSQVILRGAFGLGGLTFIGPTGETLVRPPGLSDNPGAAAGAGMISGIIGAIFFVAPSGMIMKGFASLFALAGATVIYLTFVRTCMVILVGMMLVYGGRLALTRWKGRALLFGALASVVLVYAFRGAVQLGGAGVAERAQSLQGNPLEVYNKHRGGMMQTEVRSYLSDYPFGAGLGRWGMMRHYFGDPNNPDSPMLWSEIQLPSWILDGGIFLVLFYGFALALAVRQELRYVRSISDQELRFWATAVLAVNSGTIASMFGFTPFTTQMGLQYWFLTGVLHGAAQLAGIQSDEPIRAG